MWRIAGDTSTDFNHYTKRMTLGAVYGSTLLVWLDDQSEGLGETAAFLDRRIDDVMQLREMEGASGAARPSDGSACRASSGGCATRRGEPIGLRQFPYGHLKTLMIITRKNERALPIPRRSASTSCSWARGRASLSIDWDALDEGEACRLRHFGFDEGVAVEAMHLGPFGRDPIACGSAG